jgi:hypothetical protein
MRLPETPKLREKPGTAITLCALLARAGVKKGRLPLFSVECLVKGSYLSTYNQSTSQRFPLGFAKPQAYNGFHTGAVVAATLNNQGVGADEGKEKSRIKI